jgi:hydroxymethylbilane synthase
VTPLRIGTRRSALALAQAGAVRTMLVAGGAEAELVPLSTSGDEGAPVAASARGLKGLFVDAIPDALERGDIDLAVHSAKDLPAEEDEEFSIGAVPQRADPRDVLVMRSAELPSGATIGTSSVRRRAQLLRSFPGIGVVDLRGNVDTRLRKLERGDVDAVVLAAAGLARLGIEPQHGAPLQPDVMLPAPGQGCLAIQIRTDDDRAVDAVSPLDHPPSRAALDAERSLMWRLGGGCALPLGALATVDGAGIVLDAVVATPDGSRLLRARADAPSPDDAAASVAKILIDDGAEAILDEVRTEA